MYRLTVVILAAVDAAVAAAVGLAATLAPLTLLWVFGLGGSADWGALWPASSTIWQLGNLVPLLISLPDEYVVAAGVDPGAARFALTLAPLTFAAFTALFAARLGVRASKADAWATGAATGTVVFTTAAALVALPSANGVARGDFWKGVLFPALVFGIPVWAGAFVTEWREAGAGGVARLRDRVETSRVWGRVPGLIIRGGAAAAVGLIGAGALLVAVSLLLRGGEVIALFEAAHVDALGATVLTLAQSAYLPNLVVWAIAFLVGPGFAVGAGSAVSPAGTQLGVVPGIPILGIVPESTTSWLLLLALVPVGIGALAGWIARSGLREAVGPEPIGLRAAVAGGIAVLAAAAGALLAVLASGSLGPGRLSDLGPEPGPVALAIGLEVLVGAGILLLSPRPAEKPAGITDAVPVAEAAADRDAAGGASIVPPAPASDDPDSTETADLSDLRRPLGPPA